MKNPLVSILCVSYNHVAFIEKCLQGFIDQECDFDFEVLINDDASTDGTQEIIKDFQEKYPEIIKPIFQTENQWTKTPGSMNLRFNYPRARGEFIALCDGDDVWIDKKKLQKQVDFLRTNQDCILVCSGYRLNRDSEKRSVVKENIVSPEQEDENGFFFELEDLEKSWFIRNSTLLLRNDKKGMEPLKQYKSTFDMHVFYYALKLGKGYYSKEIMAQYNKHSGGEYSRRSVFEVLVTHYIILKEMYEKHSDVFLKNQYFKVLLKMINLNISGVSFLKNNKDLEQKNMSLNVRQLYREAKNLAQTKDEKTRLKKSLIPIQLKRIKSSLLSRK